MASWNDDCLTLVSKVTGINLGCSGIVMQYHGNVALIHLTTIDYRTTQFTMNNDDYEKLQLEISLARYLYDFKTAGPLFFAGLEFNCSTHFEGSSVIFDGYLSSRGTFSDGFNTYNGHSTCPLNKLRLELDGLFRRQGWAPSPSEHDAKYATRCSKVMSEMFKLYIDITGMSPPNSVYNKFVAVCQTRINSLLARSLNSESEDKTHRRINYLLDTLDWLKDRHHSDKNLGNRISELVKEIRELKKDYRF